MNTKKERPKNNDNIGMRKRKKDRDKYNPVEKKRKGGIKPHQQKKKIIYYGEHTKSKREKNNKLQHQIKIKKKTDTLTTWLDME